MVVVRAITSIDHADKVDKGRVNASLYGRMENSIRKAMSLEVQKGKSMLKAYPPGCRRLCAFERVVCQISVGPNPTPRTKYWSDEGLLQVEEPLGASRSGRRSVVRTCGL